jgi:hypothetical protein
MIGNIIYLFLVIPNGVGLWATSVTLVIVPTAEVKVLHQLIVEFLEGVGHTAMVSERVNLNDDFLARTPMGDGIDNGGRPTQPMSVISVSLEELAILNAVY